MTTRLSNIVRADATLAMATRATQGAAMGLGVLLLVWRTSPSEQGFYFTFISLGILLQLCDFGLSYASLQAASQLLALGRTRELAALAWRALRLNAAVTTVAAFAVAGLGWWMFSRAPGDATVAWKAAWACFVVGVALNALTSPYVFIVEGGLSVARAWRFRLLQEVLSGIALLAVLAAGFGLWALVAYYGTRCTLAVAWMRAAPLGPAGAGVAAPPPYRWRVDLWPFQWRVGLSAVGSYLVFQAFGPILFALRGPEDAGRFALSLSVMNAIVMVTTAWPVSQAAHFGVMVGRRQGRDLSARWTRLLLQSTAFAAAGALATIVAFFVLRRLEPEAMARFAGPAATGLLVASAVAHHVVACISVVLRSERRDPLLVPGLVGGVVTLGLMTVAALRSELAWVALAYCGCTACLVPVAFAIYGRFARRQRDAAPATV